jgi:hypothetical protein
MNDNDENVRIIGGIGAILLNLMYFCLGISEAIFVAKYREFDKGCQEVWPWILSACVFDLVVPVIGFCGIKSMFKEPDEPNSTSDHLVKFARIGMIVIMIWSGVTYFIISQSCQNFWTSNAPEMWVFVMMHFSVLWIAVIFLGLMLLGLMCMGLATVIAPDEKVTVMRQKSKLFNTVAGKIESV